ncbi:conserved hypothetical protein [Acidimicrobium ferrooxidans DSM 10331]|uniref:GIY-YIG domain-containing protein n=1 Tax=Acidimicrobium ferrooxidans (strain DSM 10331 / JCM 15462 / NBRC 103882 / ICP) TaxID=525909 RepID=C7LXW5_ACIFD|nr:GIY-YIG nuclease family protein [Acidimicrobium ferrooxidans]ACU53573.1 conserved hypothetical protein [Acidimicrobium ferrooxidans DSM 10331]
MTAGKSIRIFLADGTPGGLLTAEIMNWTGHVVAAPRSDLANLLRRPETGRTGIYILLGDDPKRLGGTVAYIGEGDDVSKRLAQHARPESQGGKDFWDRVIVLTSKDTNLTKAHARYLESRLITLAQQAHRAALDNATAPPPPQLPEADVSDMEYFIAQAMIVLPVLGVNLLRSTASRSVMAAADHAGQATIEAPYPASPLLHYTLKRAGISATAQEIDGEFTVLAGSTARKDWQGADDSSYKPLHQRLVDDGTLALSPDGTTRTFTRNCVFSSPSAASSMVAGRADNGRTSWKVEGLGITYGEWQSRDVQQLLEEPSS